MTKSCNKTNVTKSCKNEILQTYILDKLRRRLRLEGRDQKMLSSYNNLCSLFPPINLQRPQHIFPSTKRLMNSTVCFVSEEKQKQKKKKITVIESSKELDRISTPCTEKKRLERNRSEWNTYQIAAVMFSVGITSMVVAAGYYRFSWQMQGGEFSGLEMLGTFVVSIGAAVGMEYWAKWAHRTIWHTSLWQIHKSHHLPREGLFELNDLLAIINAIPAVSLLFYGFFNRGLLPGICFVSGLEITVFGMVYMFIHDGLVHRRFPVGPIANVPYFRRIAAAHQIHHSDKFNGVPYGFFLGHKELEEVGGLEELEKEINRRIKLSGRS